MIYSDRINGHACCTGTTMNENSVLEYCNVQSFLRGQKKICPVRTAWSKWSG